MSATMHLRLDAYAGLASHVERANTFGTVNLVGRQRHHVDWQYIQINRHFASSLSRIHMKQHLFGAANRTNCGHVLNNTGLVVDHHH